MKVIIIGGGIGGLSAAAAVSPFCDHVTLIEKDNPPTAEAPRRYAPQAAHIHILLLAGLNMLEEMLPGIHNTLIEGGSAQIPAGTGQQIFEYGAWRPTRDLDLTYIGQSRLHFETILYQRVKALSNVSIQKFNVTDLVINEDNAVSGVRVQGSSEPLIADLVIDSTGVGGVFAQWFKENNFLDVWTETFPINIFYSTIHFKKPVEYCATKENILIVPEAGVCNLGGSLLDIENDTWCVSLHGRDGEPVPENTEQWMQAIKQLPDDRIWQRIANATPLTNIAHFKKAQAIWRRFDLSANLPGGYLPLGDAIASLNPIFGQGMTVTIGHAYELQRVIRKMGLSTSNDMRSAYLQAAHEWTKKAWKKATDFDKNFVAEAKGDVKRIKLVRHLTAMLHKKILESKDFHEKMIRENQMLI